MLANLTIVVLNGATVFILVRDPMIGMWAKREWRRLVSILAAGFFTGQIFAVELTEPVGAAHGYPGLCECFLWRYGSKVYRLGKQSVSSRSGIASLGIGIAGAIAFRASLPFRFATLIPPVVFSLGAAGGHIYQMIVAHNFSPVNVGAVLPIDILIPVVGFVFLWLCYEYPKPGVQNHKLT